MSVLKRIVKAFITGGCAGLVGQVLITVMSNFIADPILTVLASVLIFGFICVLLILTGTYTKISRFGGGGGAILLGGLMFAAATASAEMQSAGTSKSKAVIGGFAKIMMVLGSGFVISLLIGILFH